MKEMEFNVNGKKVIAKIRNLTYGELNNLLQKCTESKMIGSVLQANVNIFKLQREITLSCVTLSEGKVEDLPANVGRQLEAMALEESGLQDESFQ
ncbi:MAG: hypothetical protein QXL94_05895 [Candidatus Parvarchaeum sp.]